MPQQIVEIQGIGPVKLAKRRGMRHLRISLAHNGEVRISMPWWVSYQAAIDFAKAKQDWINSKRSVKGQLGSGARIGKAHRLVFGVADGQRIQTRLTGGEARVLLPASISISSSEAQAKAEQVAVKALNKEGDQLLPQRLATLSKQLGLNYRSIKVKRLKTRWGSCSSHKDIILNCFLMQLPWELIDYVIVHELTHTEIMAHGPTFWAAMERRWPNALALRKTLKNLHPTF